MTEPSRNLTLEEIGELAGVSRSTVSRVLNGHPHVKPAVREHVEAVIARTGYLPNQAARALVSNRTGLIGLVMPTEVDELFGDPYYSALVHGIQDGCDDAASVLSIYPVYGEAGQRELVPKLVARGFVDGVIVTAGPRSESLIAALRDRGTRLVVVGHPVDDDGLRRVDVENRAGSRLATEHLLALGRSPIGFVGPTADYVYGQERLAGYHDALAAAGRVTAERLVRLDDPSIAGGRRATTALLAAAAPDAIHVATDTMAAGALAAIADLGLRVPDDVAIVGFDGLPGALHTDPVLTTVVQPVHDVGRIAVATLLDDGGPELVLLPTSLSVGGSCGTSAATSGPAG